MDGAVTTVSWIPSEAVTGVARTAFDRGVTHYDDPPADRIGDAVELYQQGRADTYRFANRLACWADVEDGRVVGAGYARDSIGVMGGTTLRLGPLSTRLAAVALPIVRRDPEIGPAGVVFRQSFGGRTALPSPRRTVAAPFLDVRPPLVWTTLEIRIHPDGTVDGRLIGASAFPRHWVYGGDGALVAKSGRADFATWFRTGSREATPWGNGDSTVVVSAVESALEREVASVIMRGGARPEVVRYPEGTVLMREGEAGSNVYLVLDGVLAVSVGGERLAELGPGAVVGERALLEAGRRTSTLVALTPVTVARASRDLVDEEALRHLSEGHHREADAPAAETATP